MDCSGGEYSGAPSWRATWPLAITGRPVGPEPSQREVPVARQTLEQEDHNSETEHYTMCSDTTCPVEMAEEARERSITPEKLQMRRPSRKLERLYRIGEVLGKGGFGTVYAGQRRKDGMAVAIKQIARSKVNEMELVSLLDAVAAFTNVSCYSCMAERFHWS